MAGGDARTARTALELAVESTPLDEKGVIHIDDTAAEESIQHPVVRYDKVSTRLHTPQVMGKPLPPIDVGKRVQRRQALSHQLRQSMPR